MVFFKNNKKVLDQLSAGQREGLSREKALTPKKGARSGANSKRGGEGEEKSERRVTTPLWSSCGGTKDKVFKCSVEREGSVWIGGYVYGGCLGKEYDGQENKKQGEKMKGGKKKGTELFGVDVLFLSRKG